ncbi:sigma-70 RNA polymerase sigma factor region 4 domain-containing protein [Streptomyces griseiscabiei]|uniref:Sigma-70 family RNA polymerase sigma factor n=1 Tax=Streptomyces griseiscabiei TaxID=2993540 RepID=A0ABU4KY13_9ACTN|nr:sigma-70 family RNA polymerase sigma factor [Streptomyces griseiscabiei]MBZ3904502.1 sigma-70 family RNA polymerase sigma factor [Streptomyces griseiscabiei]MDX2908251.1 sigma-70 family RNA polymerase sigma factor [Streptomyces griseiscabiei]
MSEAAHGVQEAAPGSTATAIAQALGFLDPRDGRARYEACKQKVAESLKALPFHISEDERNEIAGAAISEALRSGLVDPSRQPSAYFKKTARRLAVEHQKKKSKEILVGDYPEACHSVPTPESEREDGSGRFQEDSDLWDLLDEAIDRLSRQREREVLRRQSIGQDDATIAAETGRTTNAVQQGRTHGVDSVQDRLKQYIRPRHLKPRRTLGGEQ